MRPDADAQALPMYRFSRVQSIFILIFMPSFIAFYVGKLNWLLAYSGSLSGPGQ